MIEEFLDIWLKIVLKIFLMHFLTKTVLLIVFFVELLNVIDHHCITVAPPAAI